MAFVKKIRSFLGLSFEIARSGFILRNEGTYLGILWYLLNPILLFLLLFLVFRDRLGGGISDYALYLLLGIIMFNFFQSVTLDSTRAIKEYAGILKSINFPKESLIGGIVLRNLFSHFFEFLLFVIIFILLKGNLLNLIFYLPIFFIFLIFTFGVSLFLSMASVFFVDLDNVWNFFVRLLWFATPIFYEIGGQNRLLIINLFNPIYYFIKIARDWMIYNAAGDLLFIGIAVLFSLTSLTVGLITFYKLNRKTLEMI